ncbi:hypothetical protein [Lacticaseibacillus sp. GG6-2]
MKLKAMTWAVAKTALGSVGGGVIAFIGLSVLLPLLTIDDLFGNDWPWVCGMLGAVTGVLLVGGFIGDGYQLGVPRKVMVQVYLLALGLSAVVMSTLVLGYTQLMRLLPYQLPAQVHGFAGFLQAGHLPVSWMYLAVLGFAAGIVGLFFGLAMAYIRVKIAWLWFTILPMVAITVALLTWFIAIWLIPGMKSASYYIAGHPWAQVGAMALLAVVLAIIFDRLYRHLDAPQQAGVPS